MLLDPATDEIYSIHLWRDRAAYDANAERRSQIISEAEGLGGTIGEGGRIYEVVRA